MIEPYDWAGGREAMLRFGPTTGPVIVGALPLFEEANRTRSFLVTILRALADRGIGSVLPDLPGTGESLIPTERLHIANLRAAFAAAARTAGRRAYAVSIRSGALLDGTIMVAGRWHLAPQTGPELLRELSRVRTAGNGDDFAGNRLAPEFLAELDDSELEAARTVRLDSDPKDADARYPGTPLWRRTEPDNDPDLATLLADDIAAWIHACEA